MKLDEFTYPGWDGKYEVVGRSGDLELLLLNCIVDKNNSKSISNLLATNLDQEIIWIAKIPEKVPYRGKYYSVSVDIDTIKAWFESTIVYLDLKTGVIVSEHFVK